MRKNLSLLLIITMTLVLCGCQMEKVEPEKRVRPSVGNDQCAARLHEMCGHILQFHLLNRRMPKSLKELNASPFEELPPVECPVSKKKYTYVPYGLTLRGRTDYLVLYDAEPAHSGMRWGILINSPPPGKPVKSKVLLLTDEDVLNAEQAYRDKMRKAQPSK